VGDEIAERAMKYMVVENGCREGESCGMWEGAFRQATVC